MRWHPYRAHRPWLGARLRTAGRARRRQTCHAHYSFCRTLPPRDAGNVFYIAAPWRTACQSTHSFDSPIGSELVGRGQAHYKWPHVTAIRPSWPASLRQDRVWCPLHDARCRICSRTCSRTCSFLVDPLPPSCRPSGNFPCHIASIVAPLSRMRAHVLPSEGPEP